MGLYAIGDLHLSFGCDKPMDIFGGWENYVGKLKENWNRIICGEDGYREPEHDDALVVIPGDISWAMKLEDTEKDFRFINDELAGKKIILKGNHDYWWNSSAKMNGFFKEHGFDKIRILSNNAFLYGGYAICGSRGWLQDTGEPFDRKVLNREAGRLELSIKDGLRQGGEPLVFLHYPPIYGGEENSYILDVLKKYGIRCCYYGHIHGAAARKAFRGEKYGIKFHAVSADLVNFTPQKVTERESFKTG